MHVNTVIDSHRASRLDVTSFPRENARRMIGHIDIDVIVSALALAAFDDLRALRYSKAL